VLATTQVAEKTGLAERVIPSLAAMAVDEVISMAKAQGTEYSEEDSKNVLMATQEMVLSAYGVEEGRARQLAEQASPEEQQKVEKIYQQGEQQDG
jgi:ketopantoate reductase